LLRSIISNESYIFLAVFAALALVALIYLLSPKVSTLVEDITTRGAELRERVHEMFARHDYSPDNRTVLVIGCVDTALEHHRALWLLKDAKLYGSAFAFLRLMFDALVRALWLDKVACTEQIEEVTRDEFYWPEMRKMLNQIKRAYFGPPPDAQQQADKEKVEFAKAVDQLFESFKDAWPSMNSYTHSGALQIARRFSFDEVRPNYTEGETVQVLNFANRALMTFTGLLLDSLGAEREMRELRTLFMQYCEEFNERLKRLAQAE
jgi:hypothetical protein